MGLLVGFMEGWSVGDAVYFTFVTGLTIGYGDTPTKLA
jgi:Ion channel